MEAIEAEANRLEPGWGDHVFQQSTELIQKQRQVEQQKLQQKRFEEQQKMFIEQVYLYIEGKSWTWSFCSFLFTFFFLVSIAGGVGLVGRSFIRLENAKEKREAS